MYQNELLIAISSGTLGFAGVLIGAATVVTTCVNIYLTYRVSQTKIKIDEGTADIDEGKSLAEMGYQAAKGEYERAERIRAEYEEKIKSVTETLDRLKSDIDSLKSKLDEKDKVHASELAALHDLYEAQIRVKDATIVRLNEKITSLEERVCMIEKQEEIR